MAEAAVAPTPLTAPSAAAVAAAAAAAHATASPMAPATSGADVPVIDIGPFVGARAAERGEAGAAPPAAGALDAVAAQLARACRNTGFFYVTNHGVPAEVEAAVEAASREFFTLPVEEKMAIEMARGGRAWRGYFPVGGELTSGRPDIKEGLYFGTELPASHPAAVAGTPIHGANLWPAAPESLRPAVTAYMAAATEVGHAVMAAIARSLGLPDTYFADRYTADPLILFRVFNYPDDAAGIAAAAAAGQERWGVGAHTDYGVLTVLRQDDSGGLQVQNRAGEWVDAPPIPGTFVCNIGDMLDRMTRGVYRSNLHRVRNTAGRDRISFPLFFDPAFTSRPAPIEGMDAIAAFEDDGAARWDGASVHTFDGTYGDYLLAKVGKVFPDLLAAVM